MPTLLHSAKGSKLTPRWMSAWLNYIDYLRKLLAPSFKSIDSNGQRSLRLISFDKLNHFVGIEEG